MIFALAVCARFNLKQCVQMVADAYKAVSIICTDGLKLLMFVKFCNTANKILKDEGNMCINSYTYLYNNIYVFNIKLKCIIVIGIIKKGG